MNKCLKKYGKSRWINIRLSKPYRIRKSIRIAKCHVLIAQSYAHLSIIINTPVFDLAQAMNKKIVIARHVGETIHSVNKIMSEEK